MFLNLNSVIVNDMLSRSYICSLLKQKGFFPHFFPVTFIYQCAFLLYKIRKTIFPEKFEL